MTTKKVYVDGYNVLRKVPRFAKLLKSNSDAARRGFVESLKRKVKQGVFLNVVFDGAGEHIPPQGPISVTFTYTRTADSWIRMALERESQPAAVLVVSSDHEVMNHARAHGAFVMGALEFAGKLHGTPWHGGAFVGKELDEGDDERPRRSPEKKGNPRKLPKSQRRRSRQLGKF